MAERIARYIALAGLFLFLSATASLADRNYQSDTTLSIENQKKVQQKSYGQDTIGGAFHIYTLETRTPWSAGRTVSYKGPRVLDVLKLHDLLTGDTIEVAGYDDFISKIPLEDIETFNPILATYRQCVEIDLRSGLCANISDYTPLTMNDLGPFFLVWPADDVPVHYLSSRRAFWVWFVVALRPET